MCKKSAVLLAVLVVFGIVPTVSAQNNHGEVRDALQTGGDRLVALQNQDGGWFFTVGDATCGLGAGVSCPNTFGVTALGLAASYHVTHDPDHLAAVLKTADALVEKQTAAPACDGNPATSADRPFTVDVSFLLNKIGAIPGQEEKTYRTVAQAWFACVIADFPSGADRADNRINNRIAQGLTNLGAWDASLDVRAGIAVGEREYALAEAQQIVARKAEWDVDDTDCPGCELLSKGLFLDATENLKNDASIRNAREEFIQDLLAVQNPDGSWRGDTQVTAYVVMGLMAVPQNKPTKSTVDRAVAFLLSMQNTNGGFNVGLGDATEVTEVDGEVLQALSAK